MRIDRSVLTDEPGEDHRVRHVRSAVDDVGTADNSESKAAPDGDNPAEVAAADKLAAIADSDAPAETTCILK